MVSLVREVLLSTQKLLQSQFLTNPNDGPDCCIQDPGCSHSRVAQLRGLGQVFRQVWGRGLALCQA